MSCSYWLPSGGTTEETQTASTSLERHAAEREETGDALRQLVARRPRAGLKAPVLDEALALEGAEMSLGVADVDREEHEAAIMMLAVNVRLYTIPGSHPGVAVQAMMKAKGIPFKRTDLFPVMQKLVVRVARLPEKDRAGDEDRRPQGPGLA